MKTIITIILSLTSVSLLFFVLWAENPLGPDDYVLEFMNKNNIIENNGYIEMKPDNYEKGIVFYPGGRVDYRSYVPLLYNFYLNDYYVIIYKMPLNLAFFSTNKANNIINQKPEIDWYLSGHSLGGAMAAKYVYDNPDKISGLILYAAYPGNNNDLSDYNIPVLSIYGGKDGLATLEKIDNTKKLLPKETEYFMIIGGNHSNFGHYGFQNNDLEADITKEEQQKIIIHRTIEFIESL